MLATLTSDTTVASTRPDPGPVEAPAQDGFGPDGPDSLPQRPSQRLPEIPRQAPADRSSDRFAQGSSDRFAIPARSMPNRSPLELLILARQGLAEAAEETHDGPRYATAHLAALRAAAAVLAIRARPVSGHRSQVTNVWSLLIQVAPELREWAEFFAATARKRTMAQAGVARVVTAREADDLLRDADHFVGVVTDLIGLR